LNLPSFYHSGFKVHRHPAPRLFQCGLLLAFLLVPVVLASQFSFQGQVIRVVDGDTITVRAGDSTFRIRLHGIDAPERGQDYSQRARQFLAQGIAGATVDLRVRDADRYGRLVAEVLAGGINWNLEILRAGLAWHYTDYDQSPEYARAQLQARLARRGLWQAANPIAPWNYRRGER